jgi:TonB family protein
MAAYVQDSNFFTRRTIVLFAIIGLHVFIAWALATGLARRTFELVAPPIQTDVIDEVKKEDQPPPPAKKNIVNARPGKGFPTAEEFYPPASKRLGEEGSANVHVCVGPNGKITEDPTLAQTSGSARLDDGALKLAKAASGHYQPATEDGQPTAQCMVFKIKFELRN